MPKLKEKSEIRLDRQKKLIKELMQGESSRTFAQKVGVAHQTINSWLDGTNTLSTNALAKIAQLKGWSMDLLYYYLRGEEEKYNPSKTDDILRNIDNFSVQERIEIGSKFLYSALRILPVTNEMSSFILSGNDRLKFAELCRVSSQILGFDWTTTIGVLFPAEERQRFIKGALQWSKNENLVLTKADLNKLLPWIIKPTNWNGVTPTIDSPADRFDSVEELIDSLTNGATNHAE